MDETRTLNISKGALDSATPAQLEAIWHIMLAWPKVMVTTGSGLFLPAGYLAFSETDTEGHSVYGGIDPDGRVST